MTHNADAPAISKRTDRHLTQSDFVASDRDRIVIPREVVGTVRKRVRTLLDQNPYLEQAQLAAVIRLAEMEKQLKEMKEIVTRDGAVIETRFGDLKKHPAQEIALQLQTAIARQEHALAISIPARKEKISKNEEKMKRGGPKPGFKKKRDGSVTPKLKLA